MNTLILIIACLVPQPNQEGDWVTVAPEKSGAQVAMPNEPKSNVRKLSVVKNRPPISVHLNICLSDDKTTTFVFAYHDHFSPLNDLTQIKKVLADSVTGAHRTSGGELKLNREIKQGVNYGREFTVECEQNDGKTYQVKGRVLLVGQRLYQSTVISSIDDFQESEATTFFKSFKLIEPETAIPPVTKTDGKIDK